MLRFYLSLFFIPTFAPLCSVTGIYPAGLKGNQVKILNRPAAVSSVSWYKQRHCFNPKTNGKAVQVWSKSEDLQSI